MSERRPGRVRIVSGSHRGRRIDVPTGTEVRPTSEKVREAVFDVLGPVHGLSVLDVFAGTGALGLEALSRGARQCVFVESDPLVRAVLRNNICSLGYDKVGKVVAADYTRAVEDFRRRGDRFELFFVDPPYRMLAEVEASLSPYVPSLLSPGGVMVIEGARSTAVSFGQEPVFERGYGDTRITMVRVKE